jgi:hypothetical protein
MHKENIHDISNLACRSPVHIERRRRGETNLLFSRNAKRELRGYELPLTFYPISALKHKKAGCLALFKSLCIKRELISYKKGASNDSKRKLNVKELREYGATARFYSFFCLAFLGTLTSQYIPIAPTTLKIMNAHR